MLFIFKKQKIVLDTFTWHAGVYSASPVSSSTDYMPSWWKNIKSYSEETSSYGILKKSSTIKRCDGIIELYKNSITIPLWSDLSLRTEENGRFAYEFASEGGDITSHNRNQYDSLLDNYIVLKINSPWIIKEKTGVRFSFLQPMWNQIDTLQDIIIPPGIMEFKYQNSMNINLLVAHKNKQYNLAFNQSLAHLIPLADKEVTVKNHLVSVEEFQSMKRGMHKPLFMGSYKNRKKGCPFGFGK